MQKENLYIYVIMLEKNRYFIHHADEKFPQNILLEFEIYHDFLKTYKPLYIIETIIEMDNLHLDRVVKDYMYIYGIDKVRGGSYTDIELSEEAESFIERELTDSVRQYPGIYSTSYDFIYKNYIIRNWKSEQELENEYTKLKNEFNKYQQEKYLLNEYTSNNLINETISNDIEELCDFCKMRGEDYSKVTKEIAEKYRDILPKLKFIIQKYGEKCENQNPYYNKYLNQFPEFFLDPFFYPYAFSPCPPHVTSFYDIYDFFEAIRYFADWMVCRIQEFQYDVDSYPYDIEWLYPRIFYVLDKTRENV